MKARRIYGTLTPAQKRHVKKVQQQIAAELPELIQRNQLAHDAMKENTFSGSLRRAIQSCRILLPDLAQRSVVDIRDISDFLCGEKTLPSDAIDRLVKELKLKLPTSKPKPRRAKAG
jgi:hypothetical protein